MLFCRGNRCIPTQQSAEYITVIAKSIIDMLNSKISLDNKNKIGVALFLKNA